MMSTEQMFLAFGVAALFGALILPKRISPSLWLSVMFTLLKAIIVFSIIPYVKDCECTPSDHFAYNFNYAAIAAAGFVFGHVLTHSHFLNAIWGSILGIILHSKFWHFTNATKIFDFDQLTVSYIPSLISFAAIVITIGASTYYRRSKWRAA